MSGQHKTKASRAVVGGHGMDFQILDSYCFEVDIYPERLRFKMGPFSERRKKVPTERLIKSSLRICRTDCEADKDAKEKHTGD